MLAKQKQAIEAYQRVQAFLADHPPPETPGYLVQKKLLDEVVSNLREHAESQVAGRRLRQAEVPRHVALKRALREAHLAPIAQIARARLADAPGIQKALRMPSYSLSAVRLLAEADAMRSAAALYEMQFVEAGRPVDFLARLDAAAEAVRQSMIGKARNLGRQVGGRAGLEQEVKRGRAVVDVIDTIVKDAFRGDQDLLAKWRSAKRVRALPGANGDGDDAGVTPAAPAAAA